MKRRKELRTRATRKALKGVDYYTTVSTVVVAKHKGTGVTLTAKTHISPNRAREYREVNGEMKHVWKQRTPETEFIVSRPADSKWDAQRCFNLDDAIYWFNAWAGLDDAESSL